MTKLLASLLTRIYWIFILPLEVEIAVVKSTTNVKTKRLLFDFEEAVIQTALEMGMFIMFF